MSSKITSLRWIIAIVTLLVLACVGVLVYAICTKQLEVVDKAKDAVTKPEETVETVANMVSSARMILRI